MRQRTVESVVVFDLVGRMVAGDGDGRLTDAVTVCLQTGQRHILLNCSELTSVDSSGLGEVVESFVAVRGLGGRLVLTGISRRFRRLLHTVGLLDILEVQESEEAGLESLVGETAAPPHLGGAGRGPAPADQHQTYGTVWHRQGALLTEVLTV